MKKIVVGLAVMLGFCMCTHKPSGILDVNKALDYCAEQTQRTLAELKTDSGIDYTMMPRNIMADEQHWNCRKATKEEWCAGFWPGVLWYDYEYTKDKQIQEEAKKFTNSLEFLSRTSAYDHDLGFLVFCSYGNGYRLTKDPKYLDFAQKVTDVYLERLPEDKVPYWDFSAPGIPDAPRDASAAAVVASALLELSTYLPNGTGKRYKDAAIEILTSLNSDSYQSGKSKPSFLLHSVGHWPAHSEIDASIIYADYYYIEALLRLKRLQEGHEVLG